MNAPGRFGVSLSDTANQRGLELSRSAKILGDCRVLLVEKRQAIIPRRFQNLHCEVLKIPRVRKEPVLVDLCAREILEVEFQPSF